MVRPRIRLARPTVILPGSVATNSKPRKRQRHKETQLQTQITRYLAVLERQRRLVWYPIPNGLFVQGKTKAERGKRVNILIARGMLRPGALDIGLMFPGGHGGLIELKVDNNDTSPRQDEFIDALEAIGGRWGIVRSFDEAVALVERWEKEVREHG